MKVTLYMRGREGEEWGRVWSGPLRTFLSDNDMEKDEQDEIVAALNATGTYQAGGGAAAEWMVKAPKATTPKQSGASLRAAVRRDL